MSQFLINKEELWENFMINTNSIFKMLSQPKFWLCLPPGLGVVTRPWMTEVWSRDCISYQSSDDVGIMSRVFYWVLFWDCCWWCDVVIRQWQGLEADQPSGGHSVPFCSLHCCHVSECCSSRVTHTWPHRDTCQQCRLSGKPGQCTMGNLEGQGRDSIMKQK